MKELTLENYEENTENETEQALSGVVAIPSPYVFLLTGEGSFNVMAMSGQKTEVPLAAVIASQTVSANPFSKK